MKHLRAISVESSIIGHGDIWGIIMSKFELTEQKEEAGDIAVVQVVPVDHDLYPQIEKGVLWFRDGHEQYKGKYGVVLQWPREAHPLQEVEIQFDDEAEGLIDLFEGEEWERVNDILDPEFLGHDSWDMMPIANMRVIGHVDYSLGGDDCERCYKRVHPDDDSKIQSTIYSDPWDCEKEVIFCDPNCEKEVR
jgi:hypothetical protein